MVLKTKDDITPQVNQLEELLKLRLWPRQVALIKQEIALVKAGFRAERKAAFEIDFRLKGKDNMGGQVREKPIHLTPYEYLEQEQTKQKPKSTASQR
jgi:hypothetical protein